jgi:hypothetical protein
MTEFEDLRNHRLPNWGSWGRQDTDRPDPEACGRSPSADFDPSKDWEPGWGDMDAVPEAPPMPIDHRDADLLDGYIRQMPAVHREIIRKHYYKRMLQPWDVLDTACRALLDMVQANKRVVRVMR